VVPLTTAKALTLGQPVLNASTEITAAEKSGSRQAVAAATSKYANALESYASQIAALKAPSDGVATAQHKFVSVAKQTAAVFAQLANTLSANDESALNAVEPKGNALVKEYEATLNELLAALR
jgi:hypothetical protein